MNGMEPRLSIELIPATSWFTNVRSAVSEAEWKRLRQGCYRKAGYRCEVCGGRGEQWPVEAHEVFEYVLESGGHVQRLLRLIALCPLCHKVKHFGLARVNGEQEQAGQHLMRVNGWTRQQAYDHVQAAFALWEERSQQPWTLDLSHLKTL
jgi:hypothetical protein